MRVGRNDPCPCGSGKKFKRCCGATEEGVRRFRDGAPQGEPVSGWARAHAVWPQTRQSLIEHGRSWLGAEAFEQAIEEFPFDVERGTHQDEVPFWAELYLTWKLYDWVPDGEEVSIAQHWLENAPATGEIFRMVRSANEHALSFYQVQALDRGRGAVLKNLLADEELFVVDRNLSEAVPPWSILFARLVEFGGITIFDAAGYQALPPELAGKLVAHVKDAFDLDVPLPMSLLREAGADLLDIYDEVLEELNEGLTRRPVLHTTDGELLVLCKDTWRVDDGRRDEVLARLEKLGFESDKDGDATSFRWIRTNRPSDPLPTVHLGTVTVEGGTVTIQTQSRERHARLVDQVSRALGSLIHHVASEERDQSEVFEQIADESDPDGDANLTERLPPELQDQLVRGYLERHYATWPDTELPALDGKTPREAMKTADGRSQVESLLRDMEFRTHDSEMEGAYDFNVLRRELGLPAVG